MEVEYALEVVDYLRQAVSEGIVIVDAEGHVRLANQAAESILGYGPGQLTSVQLPDVWSAGLSRTSRARPVEIELRARDGAAVPVSVVSAPLSGDEGGERLVSLVDRGELERLNERMSHVQRLAGVGTLAASMSHELTNPLSVITAACTNLKEELADGSLTPDQLGRYAEMIEQSAFRCARIIEVLRRYTQNDGRGLNMAITSPADIIQDALTMVEQQFRKRANIVVETDITPGLQSIVCDHNAITQVLINLLLNARDAMHPGGGTISVRFWPLGTLVSIHPASAGENGSGQGREDREYFAFSVSDAGTGIDPATQEHLFDPFYTTRAGGNGTGLGLFIARGIVTQHGGRIWAENNPGGGATFTVVLPKRQ